MFGDDAEAAAAEVFAGVFEGAAAGVRAAKGLNLASRLIVFARLCVVMERNGVGLTGGI
jgi:hypothetical protein